MPPYRVLLADNETYERTIIGNIIRADERFVVVRDDFSDGTGVAAAVLRDAIDVAVLDIEMSPLGGIETALELAEVAPHCRVVFMTAFNTPAYAQSSVRLGAHGHALKIRASETLIPQLLQVMEGGRAFDSDVTAAAFEAFKNHDLLRREIRAEIIWGSLTEREQTTASLICRGLTKKEAAAAMNLSESSVKKHLDMVYRKANVDSNVALVNALGRLAQPTSGG
ncbi:response regulator transcription factor [Micrococcales bacterium 31B]|nr:response regulator transcription factor [Micrococcales bacterium 31B]